MTALAHTLARRTADKRMRGVDCGLRLFDCGLYATRGKDKLQHDYFQIFAVLPRRRLDAKAVATDIAVDLVMAGEAVHVNFVHCERLDQSLVAHSKLPALRVVECQHDRYATDRKLIRRRDASEQFELVAAAQAFLPSLVGSQSTTARGAA